MGRGGEGPGDKRCYASQLTVAAVLSSLFPELIPREVAEVHLLVPPFAVGLAFPLRVCCVDTKFTSS